MTEINNDSPDVSLEQQLDPNESGTIYCTNHPNTETLLRCNRCEKPICLKCSKLTDVGYRCNDCLRNVQDNYFNAESKDNPIAFGVAFLVTFISAPIAGIIIGFFGILWGTILAFVLGSSAGGTLAQIIRRSVEKRRGRNLRYFVLGGIIFGFLLGLAASALVVGVLPANISLLVFVVVAASTAMGILR